MKQTPAQAFLNSVLLQAMWVGFFLANFLIGWAGQFPNEKAPPPPMKFAMSRYSTDEGLPQNTVQCVVRTKDGYLWVGTRTGLARFDGRNFTVFDKNNTRAFEGSDNCIAMTEDVEGVLWIGTHNGLVRKGSAGFEHVEMPATNVNGKIVQFLSQRKGGGIWVGNDHTVAFCTNKLVQLDHQVPKIGGSPHKTIKGLAEDRDGNLWVAAGASILRKSRLTGEWKELHAVDASKAGNSSIVADELGEIIFANHLGIFQVKNEVVSELTSRLPKDGRTYWSLQIDSLGRLWCNRSNRLLCFSAGKFFEPELPSSFPPREIKCLYIDNEDNFWVGTSTDGLIRLRPQLFDTLTFSERREANDVWSIVEGMDGCMWFATGFGVWSLKEGYKKHYVLGGPSASKEENNFFDCIRVDFSGSVRAGWKGNVSINAEQLEYSEASISRPLWIANRKGSYRVTELSEEVWNRFKHVGFVSAIEDKDGTVWLGTTSRGIFQFTPEGLKGYYTNEGIAKGNIGPCLADDDGSIWAASERGLYRIKDGRVSGITTEEGLVENLVLNVLEDEHGYFWLNGYKGIHRISKAQATLVADGKARRVQARSFGLEDGLVTLEGNGGRLPNSCKTRDGRLWFPTPKGVAIIDPKIVNPRVRVPTVVIDSVMANGVALKREEVVKANVFSLPAMDARLLEVQFNAPVFDHPEKVRIRYRLEGVDPAWVDAGMHRVAYYRNLKPGNYRFKLTTVSHENVLNESSPELAFVLTPAFYETWWFYAGSVFMAGGLLWGIHLWRLWFQQRVYRLEQALVLERERLRIAHDIHDDVGSRLLQLSVLGELVQRNLQEPARAEPHLERLNQTSKEIFRAMDEIVWTVNPRQDSVEGLASYIREFATEFLTPVEIDSRFDVPSDLPEQPLKAEVRHHLFLLVKEVLNNVVKHARATEVWIRMRLEQGKLTLCFEDNGCGFEIWSSNGSGNGLGSMRNRVQELQGEMLIESKPGKGTRILFQVPVGNQNRA